MAPRLLEATHTLAFLGPLAGQAAQMTRTLHMLSLVKEFANYMNGRQKWWLLPVLAILLFVGGVLALAQGSAVAPFIYTVF